MPKAQQNVRDVSKLSERQRKILEFIDNFLTQNGYPPTIRDIGKAVEIGSTSVVNYNLNKLVREGYLERSPKVSRGLQLVREENEKSGRGKVSRMPVRAAQESAMLQVPLAGQIVASKPVEFFGIHYDEDAVIDVPSNLLGKVSPEQVFALKVSGNSMIDAMISDGDIVILRQQKTADSGDMVAVWLRDSNETTLKYFYTTEGKNKIRLQPANPTMEPIFVDAQQVEIQGRVLAVMRTV